MNKPVTAPQPTFTTRRAAQRRFNWMWALAALIFLCSSSGETRYPELVAGNLGGIGSGPMRAFVDVAKTSTGWNATDGTPLDWATQRDGRGWPTTDFRVIVFDWRLFGGWLPPPYDDPERFQIDVSGTYKVSFRGDADVGTWVEDAFFTISNQSYDAVSNTTTLDLHVWSQAEVTAANPNANAGLLALEFLNTSNPESSTGAGITDLKVIRPSYANRSDQTFTDAFLQALAPFAALRYMDVQHTNNSNPSYGAAYPENIARWDDRVRKDNASQVEPNKGLKQPVVAWEYDIEIANATGTDLWLTVPIHADEDYIRKLAILIAYGVDMGNVDVSGSYDIADGVQTTEPLRADLKVYVEDSNEVWNFGFSQYAYNKHAAQAEAAAGFDWGTNDAEQQARRRHLKRGREIGQIFKGVFAPIYGPDTLYEKVRPVHAHWGSSIDFDLNGNWTRPIAWMTSTYGPVNDSFYGFAIAPYMNVNGVADDATPRELLQQMHANSDASVAAVRSTFIDLCLNVWNVSPMTYEGGPDTGGGSTTNVGNRVLMNRLPGMKDLVVRDIEDNWFARGGEMFCYFIVAGGTGRYGSWGAVEDVQILDTPKYQGLMELVGNRTLAVTTSSVPTGEVNTVYSAQLRRVGGRPPFDWTVTSGVLPDGLALDKSSGMISGTPTLGSEGDCSVSIRVTDEGDAYDERTFDFRVAAFGDTTPVFATDVTLPQGFRGKAYQVSFEVRGGNGALLWDLADAAELPAGISFANGILFGSPTEAGSFGFELRVADSDTNKSVGDAAIAKFVLVVNELSNVPLMPSELTLNAVAHDEIRLSWTDISENETGFELQISGDGGQNFLKSVMLPANAESFEHRSLNADTEYFYRLRSVNGSNVSEFLGPNGIATPPDPAQ